MVAAFAYTVDKETVFGNLRIKYGTFTPSGGSTGGDIKTRLSQVYAMFLSHTGAAVITDAPVLNETFPLIGGDVTIVTVADKPGTWIAIGV